MSSTVQEFRVLLRYLRPPDNPSLGVLPDFIAIVNADDLDCARRLADQLAASLNGLVMVIDVRCRRAPS